MLQCNELLQLDPADEEALVMLAELLFLQGQFESAHLHFLNLLEANPNNVQVRVMPGIFKTF